MKQKLLFTLTACAAAFVALSAHAETEKRILITPACLAKSSGVSSNILARHDQWLLISADDKTIETLSDAKHQRTTVCGGFKDVTNKWQQDKNKDGKAFLVKQTAPKSTIKQIRGETGYSIKYENQVNTLLSQLNPQLMWSNLTTFSSSRDRYANSDDGVAASKWLADQIKDIADKAGRQDVTISYVKTPGYKQPSVVVKVGNGTGPAVVVGAHFDTTSGRSERKPGADDDGSGSMTVLESARTVISSNMQFSKPLYYMWYAAEEEGLVGSQAVVSQFEGKKIQIEGVIHFDMTGYAYKNDPTIWVMKDNVDNDLTDFLETIIKTYTQRPVKYTRCGYGCSDHASWNDAGYRAVIPAESRFEDTNPVLHSSHDTIDRLSITHMTDYAKIATAFAVELAEPV